MSRVLRFRVEKLIRDGLPAMMRAQGLSVFERRLDEAEFIAALKKKLLEEATEAASATGAELAEELADVLEVLLTLARASGASPDDIEARRLKKRSERGGFEARIYNAAIEAEPGSPAADYYLARPEQYPLLRGSSPLEKR